MGACCPTMKGQKHIPRTDDGSARCAISHRQCWERSFEYPNRCDLRCRHDIRRARNSSVGRCHVEIFVRPMRYKGCHQPHNAQVAICAFFTTPNPLKLQERRKFAKFVPYRKSCTRTAAKSPQRLTRGFAIPPAVSSLGGLRTPAPSARRHRHGAGIRKPSHKRTHALQQTASFSRSARLRGRGSPREDRGRAF
jgi:hypothetical protein